MKWEQDLIKDIRTGTSYDDRDNGDPHPRSYNGAVEFTDCNRSSLEEYFKKIKSGCMAILEIGVCRNSSQSSTHVFLNNKRDDCAYVGIDLDDKSFLNNDAKRVYTIRNSSSDIYTNMEIMQRHGIDKFDFIFIDGWHSINQCLIDWEYTNWLSEGGIVGFHDVSCHPGPREFINALDTSKWNVVKNTCPDDWGIGFAWKK